MAAAENEHPVRIEVATAEGYMRPLLYDFFMTRYIAAYANEINAFISAVGGEAGGIPTGIDGLNALLIAEAVLNPPTATACHHRKPISGLMCCLIWNGADDLAGRNR